MENTVRKLQKELNAGTVSLVLLALLDRAGEPLYGYQIAKRLEARSGDGDTIKHGTLYPVLRSLEAQGLVTSMVAPSGSGPPRRYYTVTADGQTALGLWREAWARTRDLVEAALEGNDNA